MSSLTSAMARESRLQVSGLSVADVIAVVAAGLVLVAFLVLPWITLADGSYSPQALLNQVDALPAATTNSAVNSLVYLPVYELGFVPIGAVLGIAFALAALYSGKNRERRRAFAVASYFSGLLVLIYFLVYFGSDRILSGSLSRSAPGANFSIVGLTNIGFWLALLGCLVLIVQLFLPRPGTLWQRQVQFGARIVILSIAVVFALVPIIWVFSASFNPTRTMSGQWLIPANASLNNFNELLGNASGLRPFWMWLGNSIKVSGITTILAVLITSLAAYAFSRFRFRGRRGLLMTLLLVQVFPNLLAMVALYLILQALGPHIPWLGLNTHGGLILVYLGGTLGINTWLMKGFFDSVPRDIDESAMVDGASDWQIFWQLIFPLVRPILAVVAIFAFVGTFNEFLLARIFLQETQQYTLMVGLFLLIDGQFAQDWGIFAAGAVMGAVPIVIVYLFLQDQIVGGLTQGAVKG